MMNGKMKKYKLVPLLEKSLDFNNRTPREICEMRKNDHKLLHHLK